MPAVRRKRAAAVTSAARTRLLVTKIGANGGTRRPTEGAQRLTAMWRAQATRPAPPKKTVAVATLSSSSSSSGTASTAAMVDRRVRAASHISILSASTVTSLESRDALDSLESKESSEWPTSLNSRSGSTGPLSSLNSRSGSTSPPSSTSSYRTASSTIAEPQASSSSAQSARAALTRTAASSPLTTPSSPLTAPPSPPSSYPCPPALQPPRSPRGRGRPRKYPATSSRPAASSRPAPAPAPRPPPLRHRSPQPPKRTQPPRSAAKSYIPRNVIPPPPGFLGSKPLPDKSIKVIESFERFLCPLTRTVLVGAVRNRCGHVYSRHAILAHIRVSTACPVCSDRIVKRSLLSDPEAEKRSQKLEAAYNARLVAKARTIGVVDLTAIEDEDEDYDENEPELVDSGSDTDVIDATGF